MNKVDVYVKDEGYADFRFVTDRAKRVAFRLGLNNDLQACGNLYCGKPVWNSDTKVGVYHSGQPVNKVHSIIKQLKERGLVIESEY